jgi:hypothetical protein
MDPKNKLLDDDDNNGTTHRESPSRTYLIGIEGVMDSKATSKLSSALHESLIDEEADSIQVPSEKRHHLSEVNLLRPNYRHSKEELELSHSLADHIVIENLAGQIFKEWDVTNDGEISAEDLTDSGFDRDFGEALGRVLDCDKSGRIIRDGVQTQLSCVQY